jgi:hypothetical protein
MRLQRCELDIENMVPWPELMRSSTKASIMALSGLREKTSKVGISKH